MISSPFFYKMTKFNLSFCKKFKSIKIKNGLVKTKIEQNSLTYLGIERDYENQIEKNLRWFLDTPTYKVDNYIGKTKKEIKNTQFYNYVYYGNGDTLIYQSPDQGEKIKEGDTIMLYLG